MSEGPAQPSSSDEDAGFVRAAQKGDEEAFRQLYERYKDKVYTTVHRIVGGGEEAADVTQDVFVKVYNDLSTFQFRSKFSTWLYRIAVNFSINKVNERERHGKAERKLAYDHQPPASNAGPPIERLHRAIDELNPKLRLTVLLRYQHDLPYEEIAEVLDLSIGTVKSRLHLAHEALRKLLADLTQEPEDRT